jgi:hypothetical protein
MDGEQQKLYTDNQNVVKIVKKGSMKPELHNISLFMFPIMFII